MDIDNITRVVGMGFIILTLLVRFFKLKKRFIKRINLMTSLGYCIFAYTSAVVFVKMFNLANFTYRNELTLDLINQNKTYVFLAWVLIGLSVLIAYISLLFEEKKDKKIPSYKG